MVECLINFRNCTNDFFSKTNVDNYNSCLKKAKECINEFETLKKNLKTMFRKKKKDYIQEAERRIHNKETNNLNIKNPVRLLDFHE